MTISSTIRKAGPFTGNDSTTVFSFAFKVFTASDLYVVKTDTTLGTDSVLVLTTDYTVSLNANQNSNPGGTVTLPSALATGYKLTITSSLQYLQPTDLTNQGGFYPSVITNALDRLTIFVQQLYDQVSRSLKVSVSTPDGVQTTLPPPAANKLIGWNPTADNLQNMDPTTLATIVAFGTANADTFDGDGVTTEFALSANPGALNNLDVSIGGVTQTPVADYTWTAGTTITFTSAPPVGTDNILVRYMQGLPQGYTTADIVGYGPTSTVETALRNIDGYLSGGSGSAATVAAVASELSTGKWFKVRMAHNSDYGMTLNGKAVKVLDVYATELSQWTVTSPVIASKTAAKTNVYRTVCLNMLSADVEYLFRYISSLDIYEVYVDTVYKHVFIPCGNGKEITELQDALTFASQFRIASYLDPIYVQVQSSTEYFPLKGQISIAIASGTAGSPVTSVMTKPVRCGENTLNGIEIVNELRYTSSMDAAGCIVQFNMTLGTDDLACLNVWKSDLGEIRGITFKFSGNFSVTNQSVVGYWNSTSRFKTCVIDITGATVSGGVLAYGLNCASVVGETNGVTIKCPTTLTTGLFAVRTGHSISGLTVTGKPEYIIRYANSIELFSLSATDGGSTYALYSDQSGEIRLASGSLSAAQLFPSTATGRVRVASSGFTLTIATLNNKWVNKTDNNGSQVIIPSLGRVVTNWSGLNTPTVVAGATTVSLKDGQLNKLFISSGNADIITLNLDAGLYSLADTGESHVIELSVMKSGSGTINLVYNASGNILPTNAGGTIALANNEPIKLIYEPSVARWLVLR